jgi:hypothetical protein
MQRCHRTIPRRFRSLCWAAPEENFVLANQEASHDGDLPHKKTFNSK